MRRGAAIAAALLGVCAGGELAAQPADGQPAPAPRFSHAVHFERTAAAGRNPACTDCHGVGVRASESRPGTTSHAGCDGAGCHAEAFYGPEPNGGLCRACHTRATPWGEAPLIAFPSRARRDRDMCITFDHAAHLEPARLDGEGAAAVEQACNDCHRVLDGSRRPSPPDHAACSRCHTDDHALPMSRCAGCHVLRPDGEETCRPFIPTGARPIPRFDHAEHDAHVEGMPQSPLSCQQCHRQVAGATTVASIELLEGQRTMKSCKTCHNGRTRVPGERRRVFKTSGPCRRCHTDGIRSLWPSPRPPAGH